MVVLVVDDEAAIVQLLIEIFTDASFDVEAAHDGRTALNKLRGGLRPCVIISDIMMPGLDGWDLLKAIREELRLTNLGVILMSAGRGRMPKLDDPRTHFVPKPFNVSDMLDAVERLL